MDTTSLLSVSKHLGTRGQQRLFPAATKVLKQLNARRHDEADRQEFANIVATFASYMPMPEAPDLLKHLALAYEGSLGLVGCFKPWLNRAVARALDRGSRVLSEQDLPATMLTSAARLRIAQEIQNYEIQASQEGANRAEIRKLLGLQSAPVSGGVKAQQAPAAKRSRAVGERNPTRDPVGPERFG